MPNQAKGAKQTEVKLLTKMTLPNQAKRPQRGQTKRLAMTS